jgi:ectoine hydroxylase-related dioxygenase (phytanoyl-CoA dioxygenase family)
MERIPGLGSLTQEQINFYDTEGYLVLENLLDETDMAPAIAALNQKVDAIAAELVRDGIVKDDMKNEPFKYRLAKLFAGRSDKDFLEYGRSWRDRFPGYYDFMANPKIVNAIVSLIGPEIFSNPVYNVRPKVPGVAAGAVPWHQDKSYWPDANANPVITAWVALVDATMENGCLHLIPRTQKQKVLTWHADTYTGTGYTEIDDQHMRLLKLGRIIALPVTAGSVILFNDRLVHSSTPNKSDHVRWSLDLRYQPTDQDPMPQHGAGFLAHSRKHPDRVATREDWLAKRPEHSPESPATV